MGNRRIPFHIVFIGVLLLTPFSVVWANTTQKPAAWLNLVSHLEATGPDSASLTVTLTTVLPEAPASIHLQLPAPLNAVDGTEWRGALTERHTTQLHWTLTGPIDFTTPIGINVTLTLPEGDSLDHPFKAEWSNASEKPASRSLAPAPELQSRDGEPLWVVPLNPEAQR
ncbi:hypothetical protein [Saccharospirillum salsuginis]|uniref:Uncharacterized protein n=1 Tax=Saccharospirillum salsuginis TaxID=418750 RepID=A0A918NCE8_9GAMM|nr:hypothetical protein [Saccharospirillum salsuginis]GGX58047.1 hypothetical protein GCM10007392_27210 [Saccharospirillum salsuginis]